MKKVIQKVFGNKEGGERVVHDEDITHIGGVDTEPTSTQPAGQSLQEEEPPLSQGVTTYQTQQVVSPDVVQETIHPHEHEVVQPVVHRERVQTEIKQVTQPIHEREVLPTTHEQKILPAQYKETVLGQPAGTSLSPKPEIPSQTTIAEPEKHVMYKDPLVKETLRQHTVEQVQPVIYRDVEQHHVIQTEQPIYERVVEAPRVVSEERAPIERT